MKKILLAAVLFMATSATIQAQLLQIGVKGGVNFASQTGDAFPEQNFDREGITSFHAGLVAEIKLLERFSVQPELLYSTQGATYKNAVTEFKNELGYISIPVMAKFYLTDSFSLEVGPQASFLVSEKNDFDVEDGETFEFGLNAGLVAEIKLLDRFAIQPELLYSTQGASYKNAVTEFKNELGYLTIPVMAKFYLTDSFSLEVGPQASFLLSEKNDFDIENAETFEFGINAGLGFKITENFFIQGRYGLGLTEASKTADVKNSTVQLSAGFMF